MSRTQINQIRRLARLYGVQTSYKDVYSQRQEAKIEALQAVLKALGAPIENFNNLQAAIREKRLSEWQQVAEPVITAWNGEPNFMELRLPAGIDGSLSYRIELDNGEIIDRNYRLDQLTVMQTIELERQQFETKKLPLSDQLPWGYHRLILELAGKTYESLIISAPSKVYQESSDKMWGVFIPLYALHSSRSWGSGDFTDLGSLMNWVETKGGHVVGTLPLLASFLDGPSFEPSPYVPASRLFWNELFVDVTRNQELSRSTSAQALINTLDFQQELTALRDLKLVDYRRQMALKRRILEELAKTFFSEITQEHAAFQNFLKECKVAEDYAEYRAACEKKESTWMSWPSPQRDGRLKPDDYDEANKQYHLYAQWLAHEQLKYISDSGRKQGQEIYLDLPLGVHPDGYDVWRERESFALGISVGAPPDLLFTGGQSWGFPPLHPEKLRKQGYRYYIAGLRNHLKYASLLRVDHVMGLHRFYWVPQEMKATDGVYVSYRAEEFYAILSLESHRHKSSIVGENLGTVPSYINSAMTRHNLHQLYVIQYELVPDSKKALRKVSADTLSSVNTHDMPPFAAYWQGLDIDDRFDLGILDERGREEAHQERDQIRKAIVGFLQQRGFLKETSTDQEVFRACLRFLSESSSRVVLVNLEDLWMETLPQNIPGTHRERPNWQRKAQFQFDEFSEIPEIKDLLREIDQIRHTSKNHKKTKSAQM
jgi:4-alpha-glucanotransferase